MQTQSHVIITAVLNRLLKQKESTTESLQLASVRLPPLRNRASLIGSFAPDAPLIVMGIGSILVGLAGGDAATLGGPAGERPAQYLFETLFFHGMWVKFFHNFLHAPFIVLAMIIIGYVAWNRGRKWGATLFWFSLSCMFHTAIDITCHVKDGPLILFPFDWETRFHSPISYWDPDYYGIQFTIFEQTLVLGCLIYLVFGWWRKRNQQKLTNAAAKSLHN